MGFEEVNRYVTKIIAVGGARYDEDQQELLGRLPKWFGVKVQSELKKALALAHRFKEAAP